VSVALLDESGACTQPESVIGLDGEGFDGFGGECGVDWNGDEASVLILEEAGWRGDPDVAVGALGERGGMGKVERGEPVSEEIEERQTFVGEDEERGVIRGREGVDGGGGQAVGGGEAAKALGSVLQEAAGGADPETVGGVLGEAADVVAGEGGGIGLLVEDFEVDAVEAGGSAFGCDPDIAVERLEYLMDAALGEAVFGRPRLMAEVGGL